MVVDRLCSIRGEECANHRKMSTRYTNTPDNGVRPTWLLPSFSGLSLNVPATQHAERGHPLDDVSFCRVEIAYSEDPTGQMAFIFWDVHAKERLYLAIGVLGDTPDTAAGGSADGLRKGGRQKFKEQPTELITADYDPNDTAVSMRQLRQDLYENISLVRAAAGNEQMLSADLDSLTDLAEDIRATVDLMLLANAYAVYFYNETFRSEVKPEGESADGEEELMARWSFGKAGRGKAGTRTHPKVGSVDRANYWRSLGTYADVDKQEIDQQIIELVADITALESLDIDDVGGELTSVAESLADSLTTVFSDSMFDLQFWAVHQSDPAPLLSTDEQREFDLVRVMIHESEDLKFRKLRDGTLPPAGEERLKELLARGNGRKADQRARENALGVHSTTHYREREHSE